MVLAGGFGFLLCFDVDLRLRQFGQLLVGFFLFVQGLVQQLDGIVIAEQFSKGLERAVAGDLVVLDLLC